jgi:hypothetical protein
LALELDDSLAEAHVSLCRIKLYFEWDWAGALKAGQRMFEALEEAYQQRSPTLAWSGIAAHWDDWRTHPRFQDLIRRMNFPATPPPYASSL